MTGRFKDSAAATSVAEMSWPATRPAAESSRRPRRSTLAAFCPAPAKVRRKPCVAIHLARTLCACPASPSSRTSRFARGSCRGVCACRLAGCDRLRRARAGRDSDGALQAAHRDAAACAQRRRLTHRSCGGSGRAEPHARGRAAVGAVHLPFDAAFDQRSVCPGHCKRTSVAPAVFSPPRLQASLRARRVSSIRSGVLDDPPPVSAAISKRMPAPAIKATHSV